jgi:hypothetical protein
MVTFLTSVSQNQQTKIEALETKLNKIEECSSRKTYDEYKLCVGAIK